MDIIDIIFYSIFCLPAFLLGFMIGRVVSSDEDNHIPSSKEIQKYENQLKCLLDKNEKAKNVLCSIINSKEDLSNKPLGELAMIFSIWKVN